MHLDNMLTLTIFIYFNYSFQLQLSTTVVTTLNGRLEYSGCSFVPFEYLYPSEKLLSPSREMQMTFCLSVHASRECLFSLFSRYSLILNIYLCIYIFYTLAHGIDHGSIARWRWDVEPWSIHQHHWTMILFVDYKDRYM